MMKRLLTSGRGMWLVDTSAHILGAFENIRGGMQAQVNVLDPKILMEARDNPDLHPNLLVRVSGYSAYFNDLTPAMKDEIIRRSSLDVVS